MKEADLDLCTDYLLSTFGAATGLSAMVNGVKFRFVLMNSCLSSEESFAFITDKGRHFIAALRNNRLIEVFKNKDDSTGILHLVYSDLTCDYDAITTSYKKRWQVEVLHKSLKFNSNLTKSPTRTLRTQSNHVFIAIYVTFKLECLGIANKLNPFELCRKLLVNASRCA